MSFYNIIKTNNQFNTQEQQQKVKKTYTVQEIVLNLPPNWSSEPNQKNGPVQLG